MQRLYSDTDARAEADGWGYIYEKGVAVVLCSLTSQMSHKQVLVFPFPLLVLANMDTGVSPQTTYSKRLKTQFIAGFSQKMSIFAPKFERAIWHR